MNTDLSAQSSSRIERKHRGVGALLIVLYAIMAIGATGRSVVQIIERFDEAPLAYTLSAASAVVYIFATLSLIFAVQQFWYWVAWITISFELLGVVLIGTLSFVLPELFAHPTVWSWYGSGYVFIPLFLPVLGLWWLLKHKPVT